MEDKDEPGKWWCFYKQNGASMSWSHDLKTWTYFGNVKAGENVCLLVEDGEYILFHSPSNGVGIKRSGDLQNWTDHGLMVLGQDQWPWAQGRLTAGHVLDLRDESGVGKYVMFFHGSSLEGCEVQETHGHASLGIAWSDDLVEWEWAVCLRRKIDTRRRENRRIMTQNATLGQSSKTQTIRIPRASDILFKKDSKPRFMHDSG